MRILLENNTYLLHKVVRIAGIIRVPGIIRVVGINRVTGIIQGRALYEEIRYPLLVFFHETFLIVFIDFNQENFEYSLL